VRDCPVKNAVGDTGGKKPREGYVCRACGSENHYIQDCPAAAVSARGQRSGPVKEIAREYLSPDHLGEDVHSSYSGLVLVLSVESQSSVSNVVSYSMDER
jgi:hypothetical protein